VKIFWFSSISGTAGQVAAPVFTISVGADNKLWPELRDQIHDIDDTLSPWFNTAPAADRTVPAGMMQDCIKYCMPGIMSRCRAGAVWSEQKKCKYYQKSTTRDKCMHYIKALNENCDCVGAQREIRSRNDRKDDEI